MHTHFANDVRNSSLEELDEDDPLEMEEPATDHDIIEGGALGVVGGAVVGALAGGPLGAVIGAVVAGAASAATVAVVDHYDHDYHQTVAETERREKAIFAPDSVEPAADSPFFLPSSEEEQIQAEVLDTHVRIKRRAYELYELRGKADGLALQDWLQAEREILV